MDTLRKATVLPDGSLVVPPEIRELLYRVLGDVAATLDWTHRMHCVEPPSEWEVRHGDQVEIIWPEGKAVTLDHEAELAAIAQLQSVLDSRGLGRPLRPLYQILGLDAPPRRGGRAQLRRVK
jgi:hypothetical protein